MSIGTDPVVLPPDVQLLSKPYSTADLVRVISQALRVAAAVT